MVLFARQTFKKQNMSEQPTSVIVLQQILTEVKTLVAMQAKKRDAHDKKTEKRPRTNVVEAAEKTRKVQFVHKNKLQTGAIVERRAAWVVIQVDETKEQITLHRRELLEKPQQNESTNNDPATNLELKETTL